MHRRSKRGFTGALLAVSLVGILPTVFAQATPATASSQTTYTYSTYTPVVPNTDRILALQTILDLKLNESDIAKALPILRHLRDREEAFYRGGGGIMEDMLITPEGQTPKVSAQDRLQGAVRKFEDSKNRGWEKIQSEIGADKANGLRQLVEPPVTSAQDPFMIEHTARMQRIDNLVADLDREEAQRLAGTANSQGGAQNASTTSTTTTTTTDTVRNVDTQQTTAPTPATASTTTTTTTTTTTGPLTAMNTYGTVYSGYPHISMADLVDLLERRLIALDPSNAAFEEIRPGGHEQIDYWYIRNKQMGIWE